MGKTAEEIAEESIDKYIKSSEFKESLNEMLVKTRKDLVESAEKKARRWALIAASTIIGLFVILVGIQYAEFKEKYADIKNTHADIKKEFIDISQTQKKLKKMYEEGTISAKQIKTDLEELEPEVFEVQRNYKLVSLNKLGPANLMK